MATPSRRDNMIKNLMKQRKIKGFKEEELKKEEKERRHKEFTKMLMDMKKEEKFNG